jgi:hypothetical protein
VAALAIECVAASVIQHGWDLTLAVQPVIIAVIREKATQGPHIVLRNIGRGPALYIHMPEMKLSDAAGDQVTFAARFESISYLEPAQEIPVRSSCSAIDGDTPGG